MRFSAFFDTNILIYSLEQETPKARIAMALLEIGGWISVQVLNEATFVMRRKLGYSWPQSETALSAFSGLDLPVLDLTHSIHGRAVRLAAEHGMTIYDGCIVIAAQDCGCSLVLSEDMQHGRRFGSVQIHNPFL